MSTKWQKGQDSPNPDGRPKKPTNKMRSAATTNRGRIERLLKGYYSTKRLSQILSQLSAWEQAKFYLEAQAFVTPKLQATAFEGNMQFKYSDMNEDELKLHYGAMAASIVQAFDMTKYLPAEDIEPIQITNKPEDNEQNRTDFQGS